MLGRAYTWIPCVQQDEGGERARSYVKRVVLSTCTAHSGRKHLVLTVHPARFSLPLPNGPEAGRVNFGVGVAGLTESVGVEGGSVVHEGGMVSVGLGLV